MLNSSSLIDCPQKQQDHGQGQQASCRTNRRDDHLESPLATAALEGGYGKALAIIFDVGESTQAGVMKWSKVGKSSRYGAKDAGDIAYGNEGVRIRTDPGLILSFMADLRGP